MKEKGKMAWSEGMWKRRVKKEEVKEYEREG